MDTRNPDIPLGKELDPYLLHLRQGDTLSYITEQKINTATSGKAEGNNGHMWDSIADDSKTSQSRKRDVTRSGKKDNKRVLMEVGTKIGGKMRQDGDETGCR